MSAYDKYSAPGDGDLTPEQLDGMEMWDRDVMLAERHRAVGSMLVRMAVAEIRRRRAAAENWMAACGQRDEARARVAELETGLRAWRADVVAAGLDDEWILTERIDALLARAAEHPDRSVPLAPGDSVVLEVDGQIAGMRTAVDPK